MGRCSVLRTLFLLMRFQQTLKNVKVTKELHLRKLQKHERALSNMVLDIRSEKPMSRKGALKFAKSLLVMTYVLWALLNRVLPHKTSARIQDLEPARLVFFFYRDETKNCLLSKATVCLTTTKLFITKMIIHIYRLQITVFKFNPKPYKCNFKSKT